MPCVVGTGCVMRDLGTASLPPGPCYSEFEGQIRDQPYLTPPETGTDLHRSKVMLNTAARYVSLLSCQCCPKSGPSRMRKRVRPVPSGPSTPPPPRSLCAALNATPHPLSLKHQPKHVAVEWSGFLAFVLFALQCWRRGQFRRENFAVKKSGKIYPPSDV